MRCNICTPRLAAEKTSGCIDDRARTASDSRVFGARDNGPARRLTRSDGGVGCACPQSRKVVHSAMRRACGFGRRPSLFTDYRVEANKDTADQRAEGSSYSDIWNGSKRTERVSRSSQADGAVFYPFRSGSALSGRQGADDSVHQHDQGRPALQDHLASTDGNSKLPRNSITNGGASRPPRKAD